MGSNEFIVSAEKALQREFGITTAVIPVWFNYTLGNMKGMFIDTGKNNFYYEVTYNRVKDEIYLDKYAKVENKVIKL